MFTLLLILATITKVVYKKQDIKLSRATLNEVSLISKLAKITWNQHYPAIIGQAQVDYMLNLMYSSLALREQIQHKKHLFYLIEFKKKKIGFVSVNKEKGNAWFINKFYIDQTKAAKGIGSKTFSLLINEVKPTKISLTVNRQNYKSVNFYFKLGFKIERVADFDIGRGYVMNDFVMVWKKLKVKTGVKA